MQVFINKQNRLRIFSYGVSLACFCITLLFLSPLSHTQEQKVPEFIPIEVARRAAEIYLPSFFSGPWQHFNETTYYNLEGDPAAYCFIFRRYPSDVSVISIDSIKEEITRISSEIGKLRSQASETLRDFSISGEKRQRQYSLLQEEIHRKESVFRGSDDFATVVTGATEDEVVIIKCHKGLPEDIVGEIAAREEMERLGKSHYYRFGRTLYMGPFDLAYEVIENGTKQKDSLLQQGPFMDKGEIFSLRTKQFYKIGDIRAKQQERRMAEKPDEEREKRISKNKILWQKIMDEERQDKENMELGTSPKTSKEESHHNMKTDQMPNPQTTLNGVQEDSSSSEKAPKTE